MEIKRVILIHGFNVSDGGAGTTDKLRLPIEALGIEVIEFDTKWKQGLVRDLISVRMDNGKRARRLASMLQEGDLLIGHSNGCAIIDLACWQLASFDNAPKVACLYLNAALDKDAPIAPQVAAQWVFYTKSDRTVGFAAKLLGSHWGSQGRDGYKGEEDSRAVSFTYEHHGILNPKHSGIFHHENGINVIMFRVKTLIQYLETI